MNKAQPTPQQTQAHKATFAPKFDAMIDALESLYIPGNQSGRLNFRAAWPLLAPKVFPPDLMSFDEKGSTDKAKRAALEDEAEGKRQALIAEFLDIREKSIKNSMLELDFIKSTMNKLGRDVAALIYNETLMDKFMPLAPSERQATPVAEKPVVAAPVEQQVQDKLDEVTPIAVTPPPQQQRRVNLSATFNYLAALSSAG
jgi:hypothetical protein